MITESTPFTVPAGRTLLVTGVCSGVASGSVDLMIGPTAIRFQGAGTSYSTWFSFGEIPAPSGSIVSVAAGGTSGESAWGYLVDN